MAIKCSTRRTAWRCARQQRYDVQVEREKGLDIEGCAHRAADRVAAQYAISLQFIQDLECSSIGSEGAILPCFSIERNGAGAFPEAMGGIYMY